MPSWTDINNCAANSCAARSSVSSISTTKFSTDPIYYFSVISSFGINKLVDRFTLFEARRIGDSMRLGRRYDGDSRDMYGDAQSSYRWLFPTPACPLESDPPPKRTEITKCALGIHAFVHGIVELPSKFQAYRVEDFLHAISHQIVTVGCESSFRAVTTSDWTSARSIWRSLISDFSPIIVSAESLEPFLTKTIASCME